MEKPNKFLFANQLRGIAVLAVLLSHWFGVYWSVPELVAQYTMSEPLKQPTSVAFSLVSSWPFFNFGAFGVSIFFLISGFVIPFSLEKLNAPSFLVARFFRIFPTYIFGLALSLLVISLAGLFWNKPFTWGIGTIVSNAFLFFNLLGINTIDLVNWTLAIEIKFYLLCALFIPLIRKGHVWMFLAFGLLTFLVNWKVQGITFRISNGPINTAIFTLVVEMMYISYMMIGVFFYYTIKNKISPLQLLIYSVIQMGLVAITWYVSALAVQFPNITFNYLWAFIAFSATYYWRNQFKPMKWLDRMADVSYPMYAMHSLIGYTFIRILMHFGITFFVAAAITLVLVYGIALFIHHFVEKPSTEYGKKLAARVG